MDAPFSSDAIPSLRSGYKQRTPDFVGLGVPKAGTSWWNSLIMEHPEVHPHRLFDTDSPQDTKELNFFDHFSWRQPNAIEIDTYRRAFAAPENGICGEWSAYYLGMPLVIERLHKVVPDTKVLILVRDPVSRTISHLNHVTLNRGRSLRLTPAWVKFFSTYSVTPEAFFHSLYEYAIARVFHLFGRESTLVLQYEKCVADTQTELKRTYRFLGVDDDFLPKNLKNEVNKIEYVVDKPDAQQRRDMAGFFVEDAKRLAKLCPEIDISLWPEVFEILNQPKLS
ncbi:MAG: sulfotransferase [Pseudomonadota bacterium]